MRTIPLSQQILCDFIWIEWETGQIGIRNKSPLSDIGFIL